MEAVQWFNHCVSLPLSSEKNMRSLRQVEGCQVEERGEVNMQAE